MYWNTCITIPTFRANIWLIETWDVLKYSCIDEILKGANGLIETWDVLK